MSGTERVLVGDEILLIKQTALIRDYKADAKPGFAGKKYRVYAFGDSAFTVHEDDAFHKSFENGELYKVLISVTDEGWSLSNSITFKQAIAQRKNQIILDSFSIENYKVTPVSIEALIAD